MKYLVMETRLSYAVVMDEDGQFLKVANLNYHVGQRVTSVFEMHTPPKTILPSFINTKVISSVSLLAASFVLFFMFILSSLQQPFASVVLKINPEVEMSVNKDEIVTKLVGLNDDGIQLIANIEYENVSLEAMTIILIDEAIKQGFLSENQAIHFMYNSKNKQWLSEKAEAMHGEYGQIISDTYRITIMSKTSDSDITDIVKPQQKNPQPQPTPDVKPPTPKPKPPVQHDDDSDYDDSDYGDSDVDDEDLSDDDSDYDDGDTDYGDSNFDEDDSDFDD